MVTETELIDIDKEEYDRNIQRKKVLCYKNDGNTVTCRYKKICPLEIISGNEKHKGFYLEIQNESIYNVWIEIEEVIFKFCTYCGFDTLEFLNEDLVYMDKSGFLKSLELCENNHRYIPRLYIEAVRALGHHELAEHYTEYSRVIKQEHEEAERKKELERIRKCMEIEKSRREMFERQLLEAENDIINRQTVKNIKMDNGNSLILELFKANGIKLPIRTKGWINDILANISFKCGSSITYSYYTRGSDSKVFHGYLCQLEDKIRKKHNVCTD